MLYDKELKSYLEDQLVDVPWNIVIHDCEEIKICIDDENTRGSYLDHSFVINMAHMFANHLREKYEGYYFFHPFLTLCAKGEGDDRRWIVELKCLATKENLHEIVKTYQEKQNAKEICKISTDE